MYSSSSPGAVLHWPNGMHCRSESETGAHWKIQQLDDDALGSEDYNEDFYVSDDDGKQYSD